MVILIGDLGATTVPPAEAFLTLDGLAFMPLAEYQAFEPPGAPSTIETIEDLDRVPFYSGGQRLMGRLVLPDGEGPFPAVVFVAGSGPETRDDPAFVVPALQDAGIASFSYDKRGSGDSEGIFIGTEDMTGSPAPSEWRLPQLASDALAAVEYRRGIEEIDPEGIGLLGYSQAGWVIPQVAATSDIPALRDAGESVETVSAFLDHSSLAVTTKYLRRLEGVEDHSWERAAEAIGV